MAIATISIYSVLLVSMERENFSHHILLKCAVDNLLQYEQNFLNALEPAYNIATFAGANMNSRKHTDEARAKMSKARKGKVNSIPTLVISGNTRK